MESGIRNGRGPWPRSTRISSACRALSSRSAAMHERNDLACSRVTVLRPSSSADHVHCAPCDELRHGTLRADKPGRCAQRTYCTACWDARRILLFCTYVQPATNRCAQQAHRLRQPLHAELTCRPCLPCPDAMARGSVPGGGENSLLRRARIKVRGGSGRNCGKARFRPEIPEGQ